MSLFYLTGTLQDVMFMILEDPEFVHAAMHIHGEFAANFFDKIRLIFYNSVRDLIAWEVILKILKTRFIQLLVVY